MAVELSAKKLRGLVRPLEAFVHYFAATRPRPEFYHFPDGDRGWRYENPGLHEFCLLKTVRAVSALRACIELYRRGYNQELCVLVRTVIECTTHIQYVLAFVDDTGAIDPQATQYIDRFFAEIKRELEKAATKGVRQEDVHRAIAKQTDGLILEIGASVPPDSKATVDLLAGSYRTFSNYVHARYPEIMDMYGGDSPAFHLTGMSGTPKDAESREILETYIETVSLAVRAIIIRLRLFDLLEGHPDLDVWYREWLRPEGR
jgi:hypothetical protein